MIIEYFREKNMSDLFYKNFYSDLENEIRKKYTNGNLRKNHKHGNQFGLDFGIKAVSNDYRTRLNRNPGVKIHIVVDSKKENSAFFDYLVQNINAIESKVGLNLEYNDDNNRYKQIYFDYLIDLNEEDNRKVALDYVSSKAILLMEEVLKLHSQFSP